MPTKHSLRPYDLDDGVNVQNQLKCLNSTYFMISVLIKMINPANARFTEMFEQCLIPHLAINLLQIQPENIMFKVILMQLHLS